MTINSDISYSKYENNFNKTVLLRKRKRHTARCVASTRSVILGGGVGVPTLVGGYLLWWGGTYSGGGYLLWWGVPTPGGGVPT